MPKKMDVGVGGAWKDVKKLYVGVGNAWRQVKKGYVGVGGAWKEFYTAGTPLSDLAVGTTVKIKVNNVLTDFLLVHKGLPSALYDGTCNGAWLLLKKLPVLRQFGSNTNYAASDVNTYLNGTYLNQIEAGVRNLIRQVKIPYRPGTTGSTVNSGASGLSCRIFLLSGYEVGWTTSYDRQFPVDGAKLSYFDSGEGAAASNKRIAMYNQGVGSDYAMEWWLRSPYTQYETHVWHVSRYGGYEYDNSTYTYGIRPALILPLDATVDESMAVTG